MTTSTTENRAVEAMASPFLYPVALDVTGRLCVVVGGGAVGERKVGALVDAGARVVVIAPDATEGVRAHAAQGTLTWRAEPFAAALLDDGDDVFLLVAATDNASVNASARDAARARRILFNAAAPIFEGNADGGDNDAGGDFATMATVRRGDLLVGVTTGGAGPALAARLKRELGAQFGAEWEPYVGLLARVRRDAKARICDATARTQALRRVASDDAIFALVAAGDLDGARAEATKCLSL